MIIYLKRLKSSKFVRVKAFPMYGGIGVSAPSLHRESTDSLIADAEETVEETYLKILPSCLTGDSLFPRGSVFLWQGLGMEAQQHQQ